MPENDAARFSLTEFLESFEIRDSSGRPHIIIGGQAVNYWAETFIESETELSTYIPFLSKDIDFIGNRDDVSRLAREFGVPARFPHKKLRTAFAGGISVNLREGSTSIEFLRVIPGVSPTTIEKWAVTSTHKGKLVRIVDPISLLICKINLALTVSQSGRQDGRHALILGICTRAFLRESLKGVENGELPVRGWLGAVERVLKFSESKLGRKAIRKLGIDWQTVLPQSQISESRNEVVVRFREKRLPQWRAKIEPASRRTSR